MSASLSKSSRPLHLSILILTTLLLLLAAQSEQASSSSTNVTLGFSTLLGGSGEDTIRDVVSDSNGNVIVTGGTASSNFPTTSGAHDRSFNGNHDVFIAKFAPNGTLLWSTFFGGPNYDRAYAVEVDSQNNILVAGRAGAAFPVTGGAAQSTFGGDQNSSGLYGRQDGFVAKFSPGGSLLWSSYFGGDDSSFIRDLAVDGSGRPLVALSNVTRPNPHVTQGAFQTGRQGAEDGFVARLAANGRSVDWATYLGGPGGDGWNPSIRVDSSGRPIVVTHTQSNSMPTTPGAYDPTGPAAGQDANELYVAKLSADGRSLIFGTYLGGSFVEFLETHELAVDPSNNIVVAAMTRSTDFPVTSGAFQRNYGGTGGSGSGRNTNYPGDAFIAKLSANGDRLLAATYFGGTQGDGIEGVATAPDGSIIVSGATYSADLHTSADAVQPNKGGDADFFVARFSPDLRQLDYASFFGGSSTDYGRTVHVHSDGTIIVGGMSRSSNWPRRNAYQGTLGGGWDGGVARLAVGGSTPPPPGPTPTVTPSPRPLPSQCGAAGPNSCLFVPMVIGQGGR